MDKKSHIYVKKMTLFKNIHHKKKEGYMQWHLFPSCRKCNCEKNLTTSHVYFITIAHDLLRRAITRERNSTICDLCLEKAIRSVEGLQDDMNLRFLSHTYRKHKLNYSQLCETYNFAITKLIHTYSAPLLRWSKNLFMQETDPTDVTSTRKIERHLPIQ